MSSHFPETRRLSTARYVFWPLAVAAITYAFLAGFHTLQDFDLGWQLASGRWVVGHHRVFSVDVFSYTALGQPWIYPVLSGAFFYASFVVGGYALLSWIGAIASAGTIALLLRRDNSALPALSLIAAPLVANRVQPRAEMFTTVLFAACLVLLWKYFRTARSPLWLLPLLMILWVNLHPGFVSGLLLCGAYVAIELLDVLSRQKREAAMKRLSNACPWLALTGLATLVNPWGPSIYVALIRQSRAQALHNRWVVEWEGIHPSWTSLRQAVDFRDPQSSFWWLGMVAVASICIGLWRKQWGATLLLASALSLTLQHVRLQALFACITVVVGGSVLWDLSRSSVESPSRKNADGFVFSHRLRMSVAVVVVLASGVLAGTRSLDLISNRYYMRSPQLASFGAGLSSWFPSRAMDFLQREKLPANIFNGYSLGGYLTWRLFPAYYDYIDSRALPFGSELFFRAYDLAAESPDSTAWRQEVETRGINTIIVPLSRYQGMTLFPHLHAFCTNRSWAPVYMDEVSAVFVRRTSETAGLVERLQIDCDKRIFDFPNDPVRSQKSGVDLFNAMANAGGVLYSLERYPEALTHLDEAEAVFPGNGNVHLLRALVFEQLGRGTEAESEFQRSLGLEPSDETSFDLGLFYMAQKRYADAADVFRQSAETSSRPHEMWMMLGQSMLQMHQPEPALAAFEKAEQSNPFGHAGEALGANFNSLIATGRAKASYQLGHLEQAISFQEDAVRLAPNDAKLWLGLADLYEAQGRTADAETARAHGK